MLIKSWEKVHEPLPQFASFKRVSWEADIYPRYKGKTNPDDIAFLTNLIREKQAKTILDLGVGGGVELSYILTALKNAGYKVEVAEGNEVDPVFIGQAQERLEKGGHTVLIHQADWDSLDSARPAYKRKFDFAYLLGNSLTYVGGNTREENKTAQAKVLKNFAKLIESDGHLLFDTRDYDYIATIVQEAGDSADKLREAFTFTPNIYYQGVQKEVTLLPVYVDETRVCLHYYDEERKTWSLLEVYRVYHSEIKEILGDNFMLERIYRDFKPENGASKDTTAFIQYLARRR